MDDASLRLLLGAIAEQQYRFHLLVKLMVEKKLITSAELDSKFSEADKFHFSHDLLEDLVATGLKISENSPAACPKESPSASPAAPKEGFGPGLEKKS
jgi:hypothetical protein